MGARIYGCNQLTEEQGFFTQPLIPDNPCYNRSTQLRREGERGWSLKCLRTLLKPTHAAHVTKNESVSSRRCTSNRSDNYAVAIAYVVHTLRINLLLRLTASDFIFSNACSMGKFRIFNQVHRHFTLLPHSPSLHSLCTSGCNYRRISRICLPPHIRSPLPFLVKVVA